MHLFVTYIGLVMCRVCLSELKRPAARVPTRKWRFAATHDPYTGKTRRLNLVAKDVGIIQLVNSDHPSPRRVTVSRRYAMQFTTAGPLSPFHFFHVPRVSSGINRPCRLKQVPVSQTHCTKSVWSAKVNPIPQLCTSVLHECLFDDRCTSSEWLP